jgi:hypothetical protein
VCEGARLLGSPEVVLCLVGGDSGHVEHQQFVDDLVLAPSERVVIDVLFSQPGEMSPTQGCGWPTATSPSTTRAE